jgi:hypothetical protein
VYSAGQHNNYENISKQYILFLRQKISEKNCRSLDLDIAGFASRSVNWSIMPHTMNLSEEALDLDSLPSFNPPFLTRCCSEIGLSRSLTFQTSGMGGN